MTVGDIFDWLLKHWSSLAILGSILCILVKFIRNMDKLTRTVEETKTKVEKIDTKYSDISNKLDEQKKTNEAMKKRLDDIDAYHCDNAERTKLLITGVEASLRGLIEIGCDGPVKAGLSDLVTYKTQRASE